MRDNSQNLLARVVLLLLRGDARGWPATAAVGSLLVLWMLGQIVAIGLSSPGMQLTFLVVGLLLTALGSVGSRLQAASGRARVSYDVDRDRARRHGQRRGRAPGRPRASGCSAWSASARRTTGGPATAGRGSSGRPTSRTRPTCRCCCRAYELWEQLEADSGRDLMTLTGGLYLGRAGQPDRGGQPARGAGVGPAARGAGRRGDPAAVPDDDAGRRRGRAVRGGRGVRPARRRRSPRTSTLAARARRRAALRRAGAGVGGRRRTASG